MSVPDPDKPELPPLDEQPRPETAPDDAVSSEVPEVPSFASLEKRPWVLTDLLRVLLIFLSLAVAGGLVLILLPQPAFDRAIQNIQARHEVANPEQIALLYLGDAIINNELHIRGVVRNITAAPIEQLDSIVRLYAHDRSLLETIIVRMNRETIDPGKIAQFELVYPNFRSEFGSYSVEFKLRQGPIMPYKDMRTVQASTN